MVKASEIHTFGKESIGHVQEYGESFIIVRDSDKEVLAMSQGWGNFNGLPVYTKQLDGGLKVLEVETPNGKGEIIYYFHE